MKRFLLLVFAIAAHGFSQDVGTFCPPSINLQNVKGREALARTFDAIGTKAIIYPGVDGRISYKSKGPRSFEDILHPMLKQLGATYLIEQGVYHLVPRPRLGCYFEDIRSLPYYQVKSLVIGNFAYMIEQETVTKLSLGDGKVVAKKTLARSIPGGNYDLSKARHRSRLSAMASIAEATLTIAPEERRVVVVEPGFASIKHFSNSISKSLALKPTRFGSQDLFLTPVNKCVSISLFNFDSMPGKPMCEPSVCDSGPEIIVESGFWRYRCRKSDLAIISWASRQSKA